MEKNFDPQPRCSSSRERMRLLAVPNRHWKRCSQQRLSHPPSLFPQSADLAEGGPCLLQPRLCHNVLSLASRQPMKSDEVSHPLTIFIWAPQRLRNHRLPRDMVRDKSALGCRSRCDLPSTASKRILYSGQMVIQLHLESSAEQSSAGQSGAGYSIVWSPGRYKIFFSEQPRIFKYPVYFVSCLRHICHHERNEVNVKTI